MRRLLPIAAVSALTGCITPYEEPILTEASATVVFSRSETVPRWGILQALEVVGDAQCSSRFRVKEFSPLGDQTPHIFRIAADGRKFIKMVTTQTSGGAYGYTDASCANVASFEPQAGRSYRVEQTKSPQTCAITITEADSGAPAPGFQVHDFDRACLG